jgi:parallel beta-helix repeat protein
MMTGCHVEGNSQGTVYARTDKMNLQIEKSKMHDNGNWAVDIKTAGRAIVQDTVLTDNSSGISLAAEMGGDVIACRLVGNSGVAIEQSSENSKILNSTIQENSRGILIHRSGQIIGNQIHHNDEYGLSVKTSDLTLTNNDITHNERGLIIEGNACHIANNHFVDNVENLVVNGTHNLLQNLTIREGQDGLIITKENNIITDSLIVGQSGRQFDYPKETTRVKNVLRMS